MTMPLCMWNYRDWFSYRKIPHVFSIRSTGSTISGVRFGQYSDTYDRYAILSDASADSDFRTVLSYRDDRIFFRGLSPFEIMNEISHLTALVNQWEEKLLHINLTRGSVSSLLSDSNSLFHCPLSVTFCDQLLAVSEQHEPETKSLWQQYLDLSLLDLLRLVPVGSSTHDLYASAEPVIIHSPIYKGKQCLLSNITTAHGKNIRITAYARQQPFSAGSALLMRRLTEAVRTNLNAHELLYSERHIDLNAFFSQYSDGSGKADPAASLQALHRLGWNRTDKYTVFQISLHKPSNTLAMDKLFQVLRDLPSSVCVRCSQSVYLICNCSARHAEQYYQELSAKLPPDVFVFSQSNIIADFMELPQLFRQTGRALLQAMQAGLPFLSFSDILTDYIHQTIQENLPAQTMIHPAVRFLKEEDRLHQTQLSDSLCTWLHLGRNYNAAAKALGVHRNTLVSRLERISSLTGVDLSDPGEQEALLLSFLISGHSLS